MSNEKTAHSTSVNSEPSSAEQNPNTIPKSPKRLEIDSDFQNDHELSRRVTWKCDLRLVPILGSLYFTAFLDRTNIANAKLEGFVKDLHMPSNGYNTALWIFFLSFVLFEVPLNLVLNWQKIKPNRWLGGMMFCLGVVSMCQGLTKSAGGLYACRFIMGIFEGSLAPGSALLMGQYYRRSEFGIRFALFFNCALIGSAFSAFLAYAIEYMNGVAGYAGWRWIFILEGLFSIAFSIVSWFVIPGFPADATFLSDTEKKYLLQRLDAERGHEKITFGSIKWKNCLFDWKIWLATLIYFCGDLSSSSNVSFSPTILTQLGWSHSQAQIHQIPIYLVAVFFSLTSAFLIGRPRVRYRFPFIFVGACFSLIGWAIQLSQVNPPSVRYFGLFAIASGASIIMPMSVVWLNNNIVGRPEKAVAAALQMGFGNSANFVSSNIFITNQAPKYPVAFKTGLCFSVVGLFAGILFPYLLWRKNSQADEREARGERNSEELENAEGIRFRYAL